KISLACWSSGLRGSAVPPVPTGRTGSVAPRDTATETSLHAVITSLSRAASSGSRSVRRRVSMMYLLKVVRRCGTDHLLRENTAGSYVFRIDRLQCLACYSCRPGGEDAARLPQSRTVDRIADRARVGEAWLRHTPRDI